MMDDLNEKLEEAGGRWRAGVRESIAPDEIAGLVAARGVAATRLSLPAFTSLASAAALAVVLVVAGSLLGGRAPAPSAAAGGGHPPSPETGLPTPIIADVLHVQAGPPSVGSTVAGNGTVVAPGDGSVSLCVSAVDVLMLGAVPQCTDVKVALEGLDPRTLPGAIVIGDMVTATDVTVVGIWSGTAILVEHVGGAAPPVFAPETLACTVAPGRAPSADPPLDVEAANAQLDQFVRSEGSSFAGDWAATIEGEQLVVIATTGDPASASQALRAQYPYSFCVAKSTYKASELVAAAAAVETANPAWQARIDYSSNRVVVKVAVINPAVEALIADYSAVFAEPLVSELVN
jgi:hypothetical protein